DRDAVRRDARRLARMEAEPGGAHVRDQRQRAVADRRLADADEQVARAQVEAARKNGRDLGADRVLAELRRQGPGAPDQDGNLSVIPEARRSLAVRNPAARNARLDSGFAGFTRA